MPEMIMIVIVLIMLGVSAGIVFALVWYFSPRRKAARLPQGPRGVAERLSELDDLRSRNLITESEYA
jgi:hypothetical protein